MVHTRQMMKQAMWIVYVIFVAAAFVTGWHPGVFDFTVRFGVVKGIVLLVLVGFLAYSLYCSSRESLPATIKKMNKFHWGRQVGIDLYIGVFFTLFLIYLNEGSILPVVLWLAPCLIFANLATLVYIFIHFDALAAHFIA